MDTESAREWLIKAGLYATGIAFVFYLLAPALHYPISYDQTPRILEVVLPVFLGYVGTATHFIFQQGDRTTAAVKLPARLLRLIVKGPLLVFGLGWLALTVAFGVSNSSSATDGSGMSVDQLSAFLATLLSLLAVSTGVAVSYLFSLDSK